MEAYFKAGGVVVATSNVTELKISGVSGGAGCIGFWCSGVF